MASDIMRGTTMTVHSRKAYHFSKQKLIVQVIYVVGRSNRAEYEMDGYIRPLEGDGWKGDVTSMGS